MEAGGEVVAGEVVEAVGELAGGEVMVVVGRVVDGEVEGVVGELVEDEVLVAAGGAADDEVLGAAGDEVEGRSYGEGCVFPRCVRRPCVAQHGMAQTNPPTRTSGPTLTLLLLHLLLRCWHWW